MTSFFLAPDPIQSTFLIPGGVVPGSGVQLFTYVAGSVSTKQTVYKDNAGNAAWTNPIVLDSGGNLPNGGVVWIPAGISIKAVWAPSNDTDPPTSPYRTIDNMTGVNDTTSSQTEWVAGPTPTFVNATQFTLVGDQTPNFTIGRRVKFTVTAGTVYGRITNSVFGALTTVTMKMDGTSALDSGLSAVSYGLLASKILSLPERIGTTSSTDTYSATVGITAYVVGDTYKVTVSSTNTSGTPNLNLDGLGALSIKLPDGSSPTAGQLSGEHLLRLTNSSTFAVLNPGPMPIRSYLAGLTLSTAGSSGAMSTAAGFATDSGNSTFMNLSSTIWKTATTWAVGTGNGGLLDAGAVSTNAWYHFFEIKRPDTGVVDVGYSSSATNPPLPANYLFKRRIGSDKTDATTTWTLCFQDGDLFQLNLPVLETTAANPGTSAVTQTLSNVPTGVNVLAWITAAGSGGFAGYLSDLAVSDQAPSATLAPLGQIQGAAGGGQGWQGFIRTNTSAQIRTRISASGGGQQLFIATCGWRDRRGQDS